MQQEDLSKLGFDEKQQESGKAKDEKTRQVLSFNRDILVWLYNLSYFALCLCYNTCDTGTTNFMTASERPRAS